jgi:hypothetical protein
MKRIVFIVISLAAAFAVSCSSDQTTSSGNSTQNTNSTAAPVQPAQSTPPAQAAKPKRPPAKGVTAKDVAKLHWLEGSWRGTGAPKPFFNKYAFYGTTLKITSFDDEAMTKQVDAARYDLLKDGTFANPDGKQRFAASEITDSYVQFVTVTGTDEAFRMERQTDGTLKAVIEWTSDGKAERKEYILEPLNK